MTSSHRPHPPLGFLLRYLAVGSWRFGRSCVASLVKIAIGRRAYFTPQELLFRRYVGQLFGLDSIREITSAAAPREGAGSHALMAMRALQFCRRFGLTYVHTPLRGIHHADRPAKEWEAAWEAHFNLGEGEQRTGRTPINYAFTFTELHALFGAQGAHEGFDDAVLQELRRKYRSNKQPRKNTRFTVCVHARRRNAGDFHDGDSTDMEQLATALRQVRSVLDGRGMSYVLHVFSQGAPEDFNGLDVPRECLFLDIDPIATMAELIEADLLVLTKGTFSRVSGLLCDGIVVADAQALPLAHWETYDAAGEIDAAALGRRLP